MGRARQGMGLISTFLVTGFSPDATSELQHARSFWRVANRTRLLWRVTTRQMLLEGCLTHQHVLRSCNTPDDDGNNHNSPLLSGKTQHTRC